MLTPRQQQQALRALLRGTPLPAEPNADADPWLVSVSQSPGLKVLREIAALWHRYQVESQCRYTSSLMKRLGCFEPWLIEYFTEHPAPSSLEELASHFLSSLRHHPDPLLRSVAAFEAAILASSGGRRATAIIFWDRNPDLVMDALHHGTPLPDPQSGVLYVLQVGPRGVSCVRQSLEPDTREPGTGERELRDPLNPSSPGASRSYAAR